jgi:hypothetical protein
MNLFALSSAPTAEFPDRCVDRYICKIMRLTTSFVVKYSSRFLKSPAEPDEMLPIFLRNFFHTPKLKNHFSNIIDVGYNKHGPTLGIEGTLIAHQRIIFVEEIHLDIRTDRGKFPHHFTWFAFRPVEFSGGGLTGPDYQMANKFMIPPREGHKFNILFYDIEQFSEIKPLFQFIKEEWEEIKKENVELKSPMSPQDLFSAYLQRIKIVESIKRLQWLSYWQEGSYQMSLFISCRKPRQMFKEKLTFALTAKDTAVLQNNAKTIIADLCHQPGINYEFAQTPVILCADQ